MKKYYSIILCFMAFMLSQSLYAQTFCYNYRIISNNGTTIVVALDVVGTGGNFNLGDANLQLNFNTAGLDNPTLSTNALASNAAYVPLGFSLTEPNGPGTGVASFNVEFGGTQGQGEVMSTTAKEVCRISFNIIDITQSTGFSIVPSSSSSPAVGSQVFLDDATIVASATQIFSGGSCPNVNVSLPVEWLDVKAYLTTEGGDKKVAVEWWTANEDNIKNFIVERSVDAKNFDAVGTPIRATNKIGKNYYRIYDANYITGISYYRIKQSDNNGKQSYSAIKTVVAGDVKLNIDKLHPMPITDELYVEYNSASPHEMTIEITLPTGQMLYSKVVKTQIGKNETTLQLANLPAGSYFLTLKDNQQKVTKMIVKQ